MRHRGDEARRRGFEAIAKPILFDRPDALPYMVDEVGWPAVFTDSRRIAVMRIDNTEFTELITLCIE